MQEIRSLGVIGAGAWGTALAKHLAEKGLEIRLWAYEREVVDSINATPPVKFFVLITHPDAEAIGQNPIPALNPRTWAWERYRPFARAFGLPTSFSLIRSKTRN